MRYYDYPMTMHQDYGILGLITTIVVMLIIAVVIIVAIRLLRGYDFGHHRHSMHRDPLDIARERYAKGEITKEQYDELQKDLKV